MKTAGVKEFKTHLSEYLREIQRGETVLVTDRGRVVAEVRPPGSTSTAASLEDRRLLEAVDRGLLRLPSAPHSEPLWTDFEPLGLRPGTAQALLDEARAEREW